MLPPSPINPGTAPPDGNFIKDNISIGPIRLMLAGNQLLRNRVDSGGFRLLRDTASQEVYSAYVIIDDNTFVELHGAWIGSKIMQPEDSDVETTVIDASDAVHPGQVLSLGFVDTGLASMPNETSFASAMVSISRPATQSHIDAIQAHMYAIYLAYPEDSAQAYAQENVSSEEGFPSDICEEGEVLLADGTILITDPEVNAILECSREDIKAGRTVPWSQVKRGILH